MSIVFLDRDGVINEFPGKGRYVTRAEEFKLMPSALEGIRLLTDAGFELHVVSNQGCVSRGLITREGLDRLTEDMIAKVSAAGGRIAGVHYCTHQTSDACECKKPKITLFLQALEGRRVDKKNTAFIGDSEEDIQAGRDLGCRTVLVLSGRTQIEDVARLSPQPDTVKQDLLEAAQWLLKKKY